jgi:hypothetical protein
VRGCRAWPASALHRQMRCFDEPDDLQLLGCGVSHSSSPPSPIMLFLSRRFSRVRSATPPSERGLRAQLPSPRAGRLSGRIPRKALLARFEEFLRPAVIQALGNPFTAAQRGDALLAAQPFSTIRIFSSAECCLRVLRRMPLSIQTRPPPGGFGLSRSQWFSAATKYITRTGDFVI